MLWHNSVVLKAMVNLHGYHKQQGMTLLELLVAVALLSVIAVMAFSAIYTLTGAKQQMDEKITDLNQENMVFSLFSDDIKMAIGQQETVNTADSLGFSGEPQALRLQRFNPYQAVPRQGLVNHLKQHPATVLDVRWFVRNKMWYRATRSAASTNFAGWQEQAMLPLQQLRCQYQTMAGQLLDHWPPRQGQITALPRAVHCRTTSQHDRQSDMVITPWQQL